MPEKWLGDVESSNEIFLVDHCVFALADLQGTPSDFAPGPANDLAVVLRLTGRQILDSPGDGEPVHIESTITIAFPQERVPNLVLGLSAQLADIAYIRGRQDQVTDS